MANKKIIFYLSFCFLLFFAFTFNSCKKYPENPLIVLKSKKKRIVGEWEPIVFNINGKDSLASLKSDSCYGLYNFNKDGSIVVNQLNFLATPITGNWYFSENKNILTTDFYIPSYSYGPYCQNLITTWSILKLTKDDLWLNTWQSGVNYYVEFKK